MSRERQYCGVCKHSDKHFPRGEGCSSMVFAGDWETPNLEPCTCVARADWDWSDVIRPIFEIWRRVTDRLRGPKLDEVPF